MSRPGINLNKRHIRPDGSCEIFTFRTGGQVHIVGSKSGSMVAWCGRKTSQKNPSMKVIHAGQVRPILDQEKFWGQCWVFRQTVIQGDFEKQIVRAYL